MPHITDEISQNLSHKNNYIASAWIFIAPFPVPSIFSILVLYSEIFTDPWLLQFKTTEGKASSNIFSLLSIHKWKIQKYNTKTMKSSSRPTHLRKRRTLSLGSERRGDTGALKCPLRDQQQHKYTGVYSASSERPIKKHSTNDYSHFFCSVITACCTFRLSVLRSSVWYAILILWL